VITIVILAAVWLEARRRGSRRAKDAPDQGKLRSQAVLEQLRSHDRGTAADRFLFDLSRELRRSLRGLWTVVSSLQEPGCPTGPLVSQASRMLDDIDLALGRAEEMALMEASMNGEGIEPITIDSLMEHVYATTGAPDDVRASLAATFPSCRAMVLASGIHLLRLLEILVEQGRESGGNGQVVVLSADLLLEEGCEDRVVFRVVDEGTVLPKGDLARLFDPTASRLPAGSSEGNLTLNPSLAGALAAHLGSKLTAARRPMGGAMFAFELPCMFESVAERRDAHTAPIWRLGGAEPRPQEAQDPAFAR
jgi:signal transduction histidine kinase